MTFRPSGTKHVRRGSSMQGHQHVHHSLRQSKAMKTRFTCIGVLLALTIVPMSLSAQRGGGRGSGGGGGEGRRESGGNAPEIPAASEVDKLDPIAMLAASQKELDLSQETVGKLLLLDSGLMRATKPSLATVDSVRATIKAASESPDARGAIRQSMSVYNHAISSIRALHDEAGKNALDLLTGDARKKAEKLLQERRDAFDKVTRTHRPD